MVAAAAVKLTAGLILPSPSPPALDSAARFPVAAVALLVLAYAFFGTGPLAILGTLQGIQSQGGPHSVGGFLASVVGLDAITSTINTILSGVFVVIVAWLLREVGTGELDWIAGAGWATVALLFTIGFFVPWYVAWLIPLAALSADRRLLAASILFTGIGLTTL